jgi:hypothetical protein
VAADERQRLETLVRAQTAERPIWEIAGTCVSEIALRERLAQLKIEVTPDVGAALMATAMLLAEDAPEFGGDCRDMLAEVAQLGLALLSDANLP